ncbi:hypothetical protein BH23CHL1_BH23CHL1_22880 [soil metagenome]
MITQCGRIEGRHSCLIRVLGGWWKNGVWMVPEERRISGLIAMNVNRDPPFLRMTGREWILRRKGVVLSQSAISPVLTVLRQVELLGSADTVTVAGFGEPAADHLFNAVEVRAELAVVGTQGVNFLVDSV